MVALGANTETEKVKSFGAALTKVASIATVVVGALKTVSLAAWAFADSYVRRAEELYKSNNGLVKITKEQVEMSKKYQDGMGKLGDIIESVKIKIAFGFLPTMLNMVETYNKFLDANKDLIANGITRLLNIVSYAAQVLNNTVRFITKAIEATIGWKGALLVLAGVFAFVRRAMILAFITNPITWVVAAIVGLMLLIDDFMTYLDGGESLFGDFWGSMLEWIDEVKPALQSVWDMLVLGMSYLIEFGVFVTQYFGGALVDAVEVIVAALTMLYALFTGNTELMAAAWEGLVENMLSMFRNLASLFEPLAQMLVSIMSSVWDSIVSAIIERLNIVRVVLGGLRDNVAAVFASMRDFVLSIIMSIANGFYIIVSVVIAVMAAVIGAIANGLSIAGGAFASAVDGIASMWEAMVDSISTAFSAFIAFFSSIITTLVAIASTTWDSIVSAIQQRIGLIIAAIQSFISTLGSALSSVFDVVTAPFARAFDWISNKFSSLGGLISGAVSGAGKLFGMGASSATSSTVNNGGNMTVHAPINVVSNDPNKAAKLVKTGVTDTMNTAHRNMGSRVKA